MIKNDKVLISMEVGGSNNRIFDYREGKENISIMDLGEDFLIIDDYVGIGLYVVPFKNMEDVIDYIVGGEDGNLTSAFFSEVLTTNDYVDLQGLGEEIERLEITDYIYESLEDLAIEYIERVNLDERLKRFLK